MRKVVMPRIDPGMQTGYIVQWLKKEGDHVEKGEPVAIGEGEKTTFDIVAPESGILRKQFYPEKSEVQVTETVGLVGEADEEIPTQAPKIIIKENPDIVSRVTAEAPVNEDLQPVSPAARRLAREHNINLALVKGTGPGGRITREDILTLTSQKTAPQSSISLEPNIPKVKQETRLSPTRKTIAERLSYSQKTVASASIMMDIVMDAIIVLRQQQEMINRKISMTATIVKALAQALAEDQTFNSSLEGELLRTYSDTNIAVAIQTPDGLLAPVVARASEKTLEQITNEIEQLTQKAGTHQLSISELTGSTATISNLGPHEVDAFVPIINPPNSIILGVGRISKRPIVAGDKIVPVSASTFTLVFDHRVGDGVAAAKLLARVKELLEKPEALTRQTA